MSKLHPLPIPAANFTTLHGRALEGVLPIMLYLRVGRLHSTCYELTLSFDKWHSAFQPNASQKMLDEKWAPLKAMGILPLTIIWSRFHSFSPKRPPHTINEGSIWIQQKLFNQSSLTFPDLVSQTEGPILQRFKHNGIFIYVSSPSDLNRTTHLSKITLILTALQEQV